MLITTLRLVHKISGYFYIKCIVIVQKCCGKDAIWDTGKHLYPSRNFTFKVILLFLDQEVVQICVKEPTSTLTSYLTPNRSGKVRGDFAEGEQGIVELKLHQLKNFLKSEAASTKVDVSLKSLSMNDLLVAHDSPHRLIMVSRSAKKEDLSEIPPREFLSQSCPDIAIMRSVPVMPHSRPSSFYNESSNPDRPVLSSPFHGEAFLSCRTVGSSHTKHASNKCEPTPSPRMTCDEIIKERLVYVSLLLVDNSSSEYKQTYNKTNQQTLVVFLPFLGLGAKVHDMDILEGMRMVLKNGDGAQLESLSSGTEILNEGQANMVSLAKLPLTTTGYLVDLKKSKAFSEGPNPLPLSPESPMETDLMTPDLNLFKKPSPLPLDKTYTVGLVKQTEREGLTDLANNIQDIKRGITGAIIKEDFPPTRDEYNEEVHFTVLEILKKRSFGTTAKCMDMWKPFIRKTIKKEKFRRSEVVIPATLNNENVTKLYGLILREEADGGPIVELMIEFAGEALNTFTKKYSIDTPMIWDITKQTMAGLNHMHLHRMIHLDVKPENICAQMKENRLLVKITDFGSAKLPQEGIALVGMTPEYMASEISQLFLQRRGCVFERVITEVDITGKVDVFAGALVIMFLYEKVHVLERLITEGETSYTEISNDERMGLKMVLMQKLATDPALISLVIPDKCDIDMRDLLKDMTQYDHHSRYSAQDVIDLIESHLTERDRRLAEERRFTLQREEKECMRGQEPVNVVPNGGGINPAVPDTAYKCIEWDNGPIRSQTKAKLREKLRPYSGKGKAKMSVNTLERNALVTQSLCEEAHQVYRFKFGASRPMDLLHTRPAIQPVTQPSALKYHAQPIPQPKCPTFDQQPSIQQPVEDYKSNRISVMPETQIADATLTVEQKNHQGILKLDIPQCENGQRIVQICEGNQSTAQTKKGVMPFNSTSPLQPIDDDTTADVGNLPNFMELF